VVGRGSNFPGFRGRRNEETISSLDWLGWLHFGEFVTRYAVQVMLFCIASEKV
jgi:hypothetical protein